MACTFAFGISILAGLAIGAVGISPAHIVGGALTPTEHVIVFDLRLPRVLLAALVGASLAVAGASYQGVFRNPLADPYLLGAAAGAGLGATLAIVSTTNANVLTPCAFVGSLGGVALAYLVGRLADPLQRPASLLLSGVAVASFLTAAQTFVQQQHTDVLRSIYSWILGGLATGGWDSALRTVPYFLVGMAILMSQSRSIDVLSLGDDKASSLGVRVTRARLVVLVASSLMTAAAVSVSGLIGFVGLVVPHVARGLGASGHATLLVMSTLIGATLLVLADLVARTALAPAELPVGVVTAFFGAPFFALLLRFGRTGAAQ